MDQLNAFVNSGNVQQPIVIIQFARVKTFRGDDLTPLFTRIQILEFIYKRIYINSHFKCLLFLCRRSAAAEFYALYKDLFQSEYP